MRTIRRATRKRYTAEEKIQIVLSGLRGEHSIAEPARASAVVISGGLSLAALAPLVAIRTPKAAILS